MQLYKIQYIWMVIFTSILSIDSKTFITKGIQGHRALNKVWATVHTIQTKSLVSFSLIALILHT